MHIGNVHRESETKKYKNTKESSWGIMDPDTLQVSSVTQANVFRNNIDSANYLSGHKYLNSS